MVILYTFDVFGFNDHRKCKYDAKEISLPGHGFPGYLYGHLKKRFQQLFIYIYIYIYK